MNIKYKIPILSIILFLLLSLSLFVIQSQYIPVNTGDNLDLVYTSFEGIELNSLEKNGNKFRVTGEDPYILFRDVDVYTERVDVDLSDVVGNISFVRLYYSSEPVLYGEQFLKDTSDDGKYSFSLDMPVNLIRVDIEGAKEGVSFTVDSIKVVNWFSSKFQRVMTDYYYWIVMGVLSLIGFVIYAFKTEEKTFISLTRLIVFSVTYFLVFHMLIKNPDCKVLGLLILALSFFTIFSYGVLKEKYFYTGLFSLCFLLYLCWSVYIPFDQAPDEYMRYDIPLFIYQNGVLPKGWEESIRNPIWGFSYGFQPSLASYVGAVFMKVSEGFLGSKKLYLAARFVSVLSGTGTVIMSKKIGDKLFSPAAKLLFVISIAFLPQFMFISGYFNNDAFGFFTIALIVYAMILCHETGWGKKECIFLGIGCGLCGLSYYNCFCIIGAAIIFSLWDTLSKKETRSFSFVSKRFMIVFLVAFLVAGWAYIRNYINYDGDFLGLRTRDLYGEMYAKDLYKPSIHSTPQNTGESIKYMLFEHGWLELSIKSSIGVFSYMSIFLNEVIYLAVGIIVALGIVMAIGYAIKRFVVNKKISAFWLSLVINCIFVFGLGVMYSYTGGFSPQGRYIMPMLVSFNMIFVLGYEKILSFNMKVKSVVLYGISIFYVLLGFYSLFGLIIPFY